MFSLRNYPKSFGSTKKNFYRLSSFCQSDLDIEEVESKFWEFISSIAASGKPRKIFRNYKFLNSGWEWSVFRKDNRTVVKIPAEIFPEVNQVKYLENSRNTYEKVLDYFPTDFVAKSNFKRVGDLNLIEQEFVEGKDNERVGYNTKNSEMLSNVKIFLGCALKMLDKYQWLPDFYIRRTNGGFRLRSVIFKANVPKIVDFTAYYDVYRLYPERTEFEVEENANHIKNFLSWLSRKEIPKNTRGDAALSRK